jgi:hypothetical protein
MSEQDFQNSALPTQRNITVFPDRRVPNDIEVVSGMIERLMERMDRYDAKLTEHMAQEAVEMKAMLEEALHASFPEGDADGHRRHHEALIRKAESSAEFWAKLKLELYKYGLVGFVGWAAFALWQAFLKGPK